MGLVLFDTSVYISALRKGNEALIASRRAAGGAVLCLSSVVLEELYARADEHARHVVERLERDFDQARRIVVPNLNDWTLVGTVLARLARKYSCEQIGQGRLTNDALIAMSTARLGIRVISANSHDFARLAEFHSFQWELVKL
jgi:predicted nucleic acid-binding protein